MSDQQSIILEIIREVCPPGTPEIDDFDKPFAEYGIDSLDLSALFLALEERYGISIDDNDFERLNTVNNVATFMDQAKG